MDDVGYPCPGSQRACDGGGSGNATGWAAGGGDAFVGVSGEVWGFGCTSTDCGLYPSRILQASGSPLVDLRDLTALALGLASNYYINGGVKPLGAMDFLYNTLSPAQLDQSYGVLMPGYSPSAPNKDIGMLACADLPAGLLLAGARRYFNPFLSEYNE